MFKAFLKLLVLICFMLSSSLMAEVQPRIIGGQPADQNEWPATVALLRLSGITSFSQFCGGSLVAPNWVLTAAHCVEELKDTPSTLFVKVGATNLLTEGSFMSVRTIVIHENYIPDTGLNSTTDDFDFDIALLELFNEAPAPAESIPLYVGDPAPGELATIVGWGTTVFDEASQESSEPSAQLLEAQVPIITQAECNAVYNGEITDNMICAGDLLNGGVDSCQGDSGGPMMLEQGGEFRQVGIVSFGQGCGLPQFPGVYTRVDRFSTWIADCLNGVSCEINPTTGGGGSVPDGVITFGSELPSGNPVVDNSGSGGALSWLIIPLVLVFYRNHKMGARGRGSDGRYVLH